MLCLMQVFDSYDRPQFHGGSKLKDHIDWLPLLGWMIWPDNGQHPPNDDFEAPPAKQKIGIVFSADSPITAKSYPRARRRSEQQLVAGNTRLLHGHRRSEMVLAHDP